MSTIAEDAGVGVGTLYRHFPTREELLNHLTHRSFEMVLANARSAESVASTGNDALRQFIEAGSRCGIARPSAARRSSGNGASHPRLRDQVHRTIQRLIDRGRLDGTIKTDVSPRDIVAPGRCSPSRDRTARAGTRPANGSCPPTLRSRSTGAAEAAPPRRIPYDGSAIITNAESPQATLPFAR